MHTELLPSIFGPNISRRLNRELSELSDLVYYNKFKEIQRNVCNKSSNIYKKNSNVSKLYKHKPKHKKHNNNFKYHYQEEEVH